MSRLEELIAELCPDGVEYVLLLSVASVLYGFPCDASQFNDESKGTPLIRIRDVLEGATNTYTTEIVPEQYKIYKNDILIGMDGNFHLGKWKSDTAILCQRVCRISSKNESNLVLNGYLYHLLKPLIQKIEDSKKGGTVKHLSAKDIKSIKIPLPPLEVQREIVRILDAYSEKVAELTDRLAVELDARKKQYEYYRAELLGTDVKKVSLKDLALSSHTGATPLKSKPEFYDNGTIPWLRTQEVVFNEIVQTECFITEEAVKKTSAKWVPANCVVVAISGATAGRCAINKIPLTTNQHCLCIEIDGKKALYKYVYYCVCNQHEELLAKKEGARGDLNVSKILSLKIPLPPLAEQERIVSILDRFDKLCNDISEGIPAEIEARRKQYEHYRDQLLTFKEKTA